MGAGTTERVRMGVGQSPQKEVQAGGAKPPRAKSSSKPHSKFPRATPTDKGLGGAERACVEDETSSELRATAPSRFASTRDRECV